MKLFFLQIRYDLIYETKIQLRKQNMLKRFRPLVAINNCQCLVLILFGFRIIL